MTQLLGQYRLVRKLAQGGMAEVWLADAPSALGVARRVVVKRMLPSWAKDEELVRMFVTEARVAMGLSHGNIAQVFDFGEDDGEFFIAMELLDGASLDQIEERTRARELALPVPIATFVAIEMLKGLHYAHSRVGDDGRPLGIVHRDVSPQNVFVTFEGEVKILDFGLAKLTSEKSHTQPGILKGKYLYFSPEQAKGAALDARTDVYATGVVLYEMLAGRLPVSGGMGDALRRIIAGDFPPPSEHADVPPELEALVLRAMARDPAERFQTAAAFERELAGFLHRPTSRFTAETVGFFVRFLYQSELSAAGKRPELPEWFLEQLSIWRKLDRPRARAGEEPMDAAAGTDHAVALADGTAPRSSAPLPAPSPARRGRRTPVLAALGIVAGLAAGTLAWPFFRSPPRGELRVASQPPGAGISLDGVATQRATTAAGSLLTDLAPGPHELVLSRPGYEDLHIRVALDPTDEHSLHGQAVQVTLVPLAAANATPPRPSPAIEPAARPEPARPPPPEHRRERLQLKWISELSSALRPEVSARHAYALRTEGKRSMTNGWGNPYRVKNVFFAAEGRGGSQSGLVTAEEPVRLEGIESLALFFVDNACGDNTGGVTVFLDDLTTGRQRDLEVNGRNNCVDVTAANGSRFEASRALAFTPTRGPTLPGWRVRPLGYLVETSKLSAAWRNEHNNEASFIMGAIPSGRRFELPMPIDAIWFFGLGAPPGPGSPAWTVDWELSPTAR